MQRSGGWGVVVLMVLGVIPLNVAESGQANPEAEMGFDWALANFQ